MVTGNVYDMYKMICRNVTSYAGFASGACSRFYLSLGEIHKLVFLQLSWCFYVIFSLKSMSILVMLLMR